MPLSRSFCLYASFQCETFSELFCCDHLYSVLADSPYGHRDSAGQLEVHSQIFSGHRILLKAEPGLESSSLSILDVLCHLMLSDPFMVSGQMGHFHRSHLSSICFLSHLHLISLDKSGIHKNNGPVAHPLGNELILSKICDIGPCLESEALK